MAARGATGVAVPPRRNCGTMEVHHRLLESVPQFRTRQMALEQATSRSMSRPRAMAGPLAVIPVVVHVVYRLPAENISTAQVKSQVKALNRDYAAKNTDKASTPAVWRCLVSPMAVQFALATKDPTGKATTGITRTKTKNASFSQDDSVKSSALGGHDPWPTDKYLNIWVCSLGGGLLGYAQFPGGPAPTDGVVILNTGFGTSGTAAAPFKLGRTAVHEVGHWLNLRHIWGDTEDCSGSDFVADTPNAVGPNFGEPAFPHVTCNNGPNGDMFMNYMDYVDDKAMVMFTTQQVARMTATLENSRTGLGK